MARMRAKLQVTKVDKGENSESLSFQAVFADKYGKDGENEDNDFARWTPYAALHMTINNPALLGQFTEGEKYYVDFSKAD